MSSTVKPLQSRATRHPGARSQRDRRPRARDWGRLGLAVLACLAATLLIALLSEREREPPLLVAHRQFLVASWGGATAAPATALAAALPDLARFGLALRRAEPVAGGVYGGYEGAGGCRLGLWAGPSATAPRRAPAGWSMALVPQGASTWWLVAGEAVGPRRLGLLAAALGREAAGLPPSATPAEPACGA
ncbi:hypothetical protein [Pseudoroseomonas cervicalis]|uniref:hypothetical protein n=1 Tax=Teichococcus cervicalis TaxID=204525 RepID=UPI0022F17C42|nr:hypothetical protein [Pseudoroseomonas cervicalis]WBV41403.1 hypothetical protein PFY06_09040 [Pseudoroseomonas cervicalis]